MKPLVSMRDALADPHLFGALLGGPTWRAWRTILIAAMGEALDADERVIFEKLTGRAAEPLERVEQLVCVIGRRGGKSRAASVLAVYLAALCDHSAATVPGETPVILCLAQNQRQGQVSFGYISAVFDSTPLLAEMIASRTADSLMLTNGVSIEIRAASFRGLRGVTALAVLADESCFWRSDETSRNADSEILDAVRPALATTGGPLVLISSPYSKRGETYAIYKRHYGPAGDPLILVAQGASRDFNESLPQRVVDRAMEADAASASAEYLGQWRADVSGWADLALIEAAVDYGVTVRPPSTVQRLAYRAGSDPSGGARDSFTTAICHDEGNIAVLDCIVEIKAPFNPTEATEQMAAVLSSYGLRETVGDKYAAEWVVDAFAKCGIKYRHSERDRSAIYLDALPMLTSGRVRLLDNKRLVNQFASLERRTSPGGRDRVDHGPGGHDDLCNAAALALITRGRKPMVISDSFAKTMGAPSRRNNYF